MGRELPDDLAELSDKDLRIAVAYAAELLIQAWGPSYNFADPSHQRIIAWSSVH